MTAPIANFYGQGGLSVTATATGAVAGAVAQFVDVPLGRPVLDSMQEIAHIFGLRNTLTDSNGQYLYKITYNSGDLLWGQSWAQQGVHDQASVVFADA